MPLPPLKTARRPLTLLDTMFIVAVCALLLAGIGSPLGSGRGADEHFVVSSVSAVLVLGVTLWWVSGLDLDDLGRLSGPVGLFAYMSLAVLYLAAAVVLLAGAPYAAALTLGSQAATVLYLCFRP
jgi:hypothetical protein